MTQLRAALAAAAGLLLAGGVAAAQPEAKKPADPDAAPATDGDGKEVELEEDAPPDDIEGTAENPDAPKLPGDDAPVVEVAAPPPVRTGYPIEDVLRPLTLPAVTSEVSFDARSTFSDFDLELGLRAKYGITRQWQIGLRYLIGGLYDDPTDAMEDSAKFNTGKAFGIDVTYLVFDWLAAHVTVPVYVDPFAMGVTLGAPMKFRFKDKFAIVLLDDFIDIRLNRFVPSLISESANEGLRVADDTNTSTPRGNLYLRVGGVYQQSPQMAVKANLTQTLQDFGDNDNPTGMEIMVQYSPSSAMDLIGRAGIDAFDRADSTFGILLAAAYRI
jgi:hypothetical protein